MNTVILIVDDEKNAREGLARALKGPGRRIFLAASAREALDLLGGERADLVLTDLRMPGMDGLELTRQIRKTRPEVIIILLTAYGSVQTAVQAMKEGAYDYLTKPLNLDELEMVVRQAIASRAPSEEAGGEKIGAIIGASPRINEIKLIIRQIAPTRTTVLIEGESGTGKELIAQAIHGLSERAAGPFIAVHCAALAEGVLESELFGHEKGSFTGASRRHIGRFELADRGTLFLDEVSEMPAGTQVKLLRVLQEQQFERVGGTETIKVDARLIAATNAHLDALIVQGRFREDLYYRLNVIRIAVPPLRSRREDIPALVSAFFAEFNAINKKHVRGLDGEAMAAMTAYGWPGNVRELRNCVEGLVVLAHGEVVGRADLPRKLREAAGQEAVPPSDPSGRASAPDDMTIKGAEQRMIRDALAKAGGRKTEAAKLLGISRRTMHRKITKYHL
ncbi:MAG: sigma-54 dependent transcriptional regulator [Candidatus Aureabacteria bacterium]|nr:sigma-54 dependent transcriptional regulator [Candidatus Auribacterota bacterium]